MTLTTDQQKAFNEITSRCRYGRSHLLIGYAGTGKTYLMDQVSRYFIDRGMSVCVTAPTHKATSVLREKVSHDGVGVSTIHSLLSLVPKEDETGVSLQRRRGAGDVDIDVVVIDEASMLSADVMAWIRKLLIDSYVIFVGDDAQLPPVNEDQSRAFETGNPSKLEEIVRQGAGNPILQAATGCRIAQVQGLPDWSWLAPGNAGKAGIFKTDNKNAWMKKAFTSDEFKKSPNSFRYLAWTNARVDAVNRQVQFWLFGNIDTPFAVGELVINKKLFKHGDLELQNSEETKVTGIRTGNFKTDWAKYGADQEYEIACWIVDTEKGIPVRLVKDWKAYNAAFGYVKKNYTWLANHESGDDKFQHLVRFRDAFGKLAANYAMTVHTSQGSTFKNVFLDKDDIMKRQRDNLLECQQLFYVALTRASDMVFLV